MTPSSKTLVIGGGHPQYNLIQALVELGQSITVIDDRENLPAYRVTDDVVKINRYDVKNILSFADKVKPQYVASGGNDNAVHTMALVAERLGLPSYVSSEVAEWPMRKGETRKLFGKYNLPVPKTYEVSSLEEGHGLDWDSITFPVVIKPDEGIGQTGVDRANSKEEALASIEEAFGVTRNGRVLLQEFIEGREVSLNGIVMNEKFHLLTSSYRNSSRERGGAFGVSLEKVYPAVTDRELLIQIEQIINEACAAMGVKNAPIYAQIIINAEQKPFIIEVMPRLSGGEDPRAVHSATGFDVSKATAKLCMGKSVDSPHFSITEGTQKALVLRFLKISAGIIQRIEGVVDAAQMPGVEEIDMFYQEGDSIGELKTSRERVGYILVTGENVEIASARAEEALKKIRVEVS